jgi:hypothetical protein
LDHRSSIPLPDDVYLALIGQVAYAHAYLEWSLLGDLGRPEIERHLPDELKRSTLSPKPAGGIVNACTHSEKIEDADVRRFVEEAAHALDLVTETRNDLLHAHPATVDGEQMLYRYVDGTDKKPHKAMAITQSWLEAAVARIDDSLDRLNRARIPFDQAP